MGELRKRFDRFCLKHCSKGILNLMFWITAINLGVLLLTVIDPSQLVWSLLRFDAEKIMKGQVWRLFSYVFTYLCDTSGLSTFLGVVSLVCYMQFGAQIEWNWGTFRFNLYYLACVIFTDIAGLLLNYHVTAGAVNLSLLLAVATLVPDTTLRVMFIIPIKMRWMALIYLGLSAWNVVNYLLAYGFASFYWVLPIVPLLNYFLFFGKEVLMLLPGVSQYPRQKKKRTKSRPNANWADAYRSKTGEKPYRHKCTVCGRTDTTNPELEFRYCSKCNGYYCYCIDHINDHPHIQ